MDIKEYGFDSNKYVLSGKEGTLARITAINRDRFEFVSDLGAGTAHLKTAEYYAGNEPFPTAGDYVLLDYIENSESRIIKTLPRSSCFTRLDPSSSGHGEQAVAANFDYVFILQSLNHDFNIRRLERYLTSAWQSGGLPAVLLTKADLCPDPAPMIREAEKAAAGAGVFAVSSKDGSGLEHLSDYLKPGKTIVFLGSSGVGKSTLVNALAGEEIMVTGEIRNDDQRGRHTTTRRELIRLKSGVIIIDTPGMRELGMWDVREGLGKSFSDVESLIGKCRFRDCTHNGEPGCAIKAAIEAGELPEDRWESYKGLKKEARFSDDKVGYLREKDAWHKSIAIKNKANGKKGRF